MAEKKKPKISTKKPKIATSKQSKVSSLFWDTISLWNNLVCAIAVRRLENLREASSRKQVPGIISELSRSKGAAQEPKRDGSMPSNRIFVILLPELHHSREQRMALLFQSGKGEDCAPLFGMGTLLPFARTWDCSLPLLHPRYSSLR